MHSTLLYIVFLKTWQ